MTVIKQEITNDMFDEYREWFQKYVDTFKVDDKIKMSDIALKIEHTYKTVVAMQKIIRDMQMTPSEYNLARIIALFHDVGRFNQIKIYGHFNDRTSINHAEESVKILKQENVLKNLDDEIKTLIYVSILNHNKFKIDADVKDEETLKYCKLIRDADKLDIYRVIIENLKRASDAEMLVLYEGLEEKYYISDEYYEAYKNGKELRRSELKNAADSHINNMLWLKKDIYFKETYKEVKDNEIIDKSEKAFYTRYHVEDERAKEIYNEIRKIVDERIY